MIADGTTDIVDAATDYHKSLFEPLMLLMLQHLDPVDTVLVTAVLHSSVIVSIVILPMILCCND